MDGKNRNVLFVNINLDRLKSNSFKLSNFQKNCKLTADGKKFAIFHKV